MSTANKYKSKQVGYSEDDLVLYEALVELTCIACEGVIRPGERFTRRARIGGGPRRYDYCGACANATPRGY